MNTMLLTSFFSGMDDECGILIIKIAFSLFLGILFLQSGLDKIFNYKDNLEWLKGHFAQSPLAKIVPFMVLKITILEVLAGAFSLLGVYGSIVQNDIFLEIGLIISGGSLIALFFGQRMAKDYAGAGGLVPYFIVTILGMVFMMAV